jgi:methylmalonyl-CoA mutase C-terminal domain/subunit
MELVTETVDWLKKLDGEQIKIFVGGTIPKEDQQALLDMGVVGVFTAEMKLTEVLATIDAALAR